MFLLKEILIVPISEIALTLNKWNLPEIWVLLMTEFCNLYLITSLLVLGPLEILGSCFV